VIESIIETLVSLLGEDWRGGLEYITNGKHMAWYASLRFTLIAAFAGAAFAVLFGLIGAALKQSEFAPLRWIGSFYVNIVRGVPDVLFFLFFPLAFEQLVEYVFAQSRCTAAELASSGTWPPCEAAQWFLNSNDYLILACVSFGIVYGAFAANVIHGAMQAVPHGQLEAAQAYVWADRLGAPNYLARAGLVHPDWRWKYYLVLFVFYILMTMLSERIFDWLKRRASRGMLEVS